MAYRAAFFAFCFLTLGIITGALWADKVFGQLWFWDPKETWSFITWLIFLAYLHARYTLDWKGRRAAILAIIGFHGGHFYLRRRGFPATADPRGSILTGKPRGTPQVDQRSRL